MTDEAAAATARAVAAEAALKVATERVDFLERQLARLHGNAVGSRRELAPPPTTEVDSDAASGASSEKRLRDADRFSTEGRGREALQIVLSVLRRAPHPQAQALVERRVYCSLCRTHVAPPRDATSAAYATFYRGRCPNCTQLLDLSGAT